MTKPRILITGGTGYIGGRVARYLSSTDRYTLVIGATCPEKHAPSALENTLLVPFDLTDDEKIRGACAGVDTIIHLAALNEIDSAANPEEALLVNGLGSLKLLSAAEKAGVRRFIYFSTAHVYGAPLAGVIDETRLARPIHPYAITHRVAEDFVLASHDQKKLVGIVVRLSNGFGAPTGVEVNRWSLIANDLCRQAVSKKSLELRSSGLQLRDFITLEDVARATEHFMMLTEEQCGDGLFNLGGACPMRIIDITERIASRCNAVLGFTPPIIRPEVSQDVVPSELDFRVDRLNTTGFTLLGNIDAEIDATLLLCKEAFDAGLLL